MTLVLRSINYFIDVNKILLTSIKKIKKLLTSIKKIEVDNENTNVATMLYNSHTFLLRSINFYQISELLVPGSQSAKNKGNIIFVYFIDHNEILLRSIKF